MTPSILLSVAVTNLALVAWVLAWPPVVGWGSFLLIQGTTLIAGGAIAAWMLYVQHQYEDTYYHAPERVAVRARRAPGQLVPRLPRPLAWVVGNANFHHVHHLSARSRTTGFAPPTSRIRCSGELRSSHLRQHPDVPAQALGAGGERLVRSRGASESGGREGLRRSRSSGPSSSSA